HVGTATRHPPTSPQVAEVWTGLSSSLGFLGWPCAHVDCLPQPLDFGALRRLEEIELLELLVVPLELCELRLNPRAGRRRLPVQCLEELSIAPPESAVLRIAGLVEQLNSLVRAHVLDLLDAEKRGLPTLPLDFLGQPLEVLVVVWGVREQIHRAL